jgi:hypothetical protein
VCGERAGDGLSDEFVIGRTGGRRVQGSPEEVFIGWSLRGNPGAAVDADEADRGRARD